MPDRANDAKTVAGSKVAESVAERHRDQIGAGAYRLTRR
jgi:hypothetical protein